MTEVLRGAPISWTQAQARTFQSFRANSKYRIIYFNTTKMRLILIITALFSSISFAAPPQTFTGICDVNGQCYLSGNAAKLGAQDCHKVRLSPVCYSLVRMSLSGQLYELVALDRVYTLTLLRGNDATYPGICANTSLGGSRRNAIKSWSAYRVLHGINVEESVSGHRCVQSPFVSRRHVDADCMHSARMEIVIKIRRCFICVSSRGSHLCWRNEVLFQVGYLRLKIAIFLAILENRNARNWTTAISRERRSTLRRRFVDEKWIKFVYEKMGQFPLMALTCDSLIFAPNHLLPYRKHLERWVDRYSYRINLPEWTLLW